MPYPLDTTTTDYLRRQTHEALQRSQHLLLSSQQLQCKTLLTHDQSRQARQRANEQRQRSHHLKQDLACVRQRIHALLDNQLLVRTPGYPVASPWRLSTEKLDSLALIERCKTGERPAWNELIRRYEHLIFSFARSLCGNAADASDITAEVFVRLFNSLHTFRRGATSFNAWLYRIIHNTYVDVCIRDSNHGHLSLDAPIGSEESSDSHELVDASATPEALLVGRDQLKRLAAGIKSLPFYQRQVLALYVRGRSYEQIASETGLSMGTVKSRLNRARKTLQQRLEDDERMPVSSGI